MFDDDFTDKTVEYIGKTSDDGRPDPVPVGTRGVVETMFPKTAIVHWEKTGMSSVVDHAWIKLIED